MSFQSKTVSHFDSKKDFPDTHFAMSGTSAFVEVTDANSLANPQAAPKIGLHGVRGELPEEKRPELP